MGHVAILDRLKLLCHPFGSTLRRSHASSLSRSCQYKQSIDIRRRDIAESSATLISMAPTTRSSRHKPSTTATTTTLPPHTRLRTRSRRITSISPSPLPETELATPDSSTDDEAMFQHETLRGRNVEDLGELEEKGLLRRTSSSSSREGVEDGFRKRGKEKEVRVERVIEREDGEVTGLNNPRDRQAFALLVVLCTSLLSVTPYPC